MTTPNPALTSPTGVAPGLTTPGLTTPSLTGPNEVPITAPTGLDPGADGTYPILGESSGLGCAAGGSGSSGGGGLINDVMQAANQLGATQAIDLIKGLIMPAIAQAQAGGAAGAPAAAAPIAGAVAPAAGAVAPAAGALAPAAAAAPGVLRPYCPDSLTSSPGCGTDAQGSLDSACIGATFGE